MGCQKSIDPEGSGVQKPTFVRTDAVWQANFLDSEAVQEQFRGGFVCKAHRLVYHSTLGLRVIKKKKKMELAGDFLDFDVVPRGNVGADEDASLANN